MYEFLHLLSAIAHAFIQFIQPFLVPICFVVAWAVFAMGIWSLWTAIRDSVKRAHRMHQIPCSQCQYFSGNYLLKCPVHPGEALSEEAIGCPDFASVELGWNVTHSLKQDV
ncbi:MAG: hypothetical protein AAGE59_14720 [Cyanobacteria bacterium P01_F01_bin.86]